MSRLEELIKKFCQDGVTHFKLGELGKFYGGLTGKSKSDFIDGNAKFITYRNVYLNPALDLDVEDRVKIADGEKQRTLEYGDVIFTGSSETPDECGISSVVTKKTDEKLYLNSFCFVFRFDNPNIMLPDFAKHLFRSGNLRYQIGKTASGVTRFNVSKKLMENIEIPIPPLEIQREIVRILDYFTELTVELTVKLTAELTARKKQYEYYRNYLLNNNDAFKVEQMLLGQCCSLKAGKAIPATEISENKTEEFQYPCYGANGHRGYTRIFNQSGRHCLIGRQGALCGNVCYATGNFYATEHAIVVFHEEEIDGRYLFHLLTASDLNQYKTAGAQPGLSVSRLEKVNVAIPEIKVQRRIASVLDSFDAICADLNISLSTEIEARKKQYEFYRDLLLTYAETSSILAQLSSAELSSAQLSSEHN